MDLVQWARERAKPVRQEMYLRVPPAVRGLDRAVQTRPGAGYTAG